jgi:PAS domain S-box-containing protein
VSAFDLALAEAFQDSAPLASGFIDTSFRLVRFNKALAQLNGLTAERDLGRTIAEVLPQLWPVFEPHYRAVLDGDREVTAVDTVVDATSGRTTTWLSRYFPVRFEDRIVGIGIVGIDITEAKQAERFRSVVMDTMAEGLYALDVDGDVTFVNRSAARLLGWSEAELLGRPAHEVIHHRRPDGSPFPDLECPLYAVRTQGRTLQVPDDAFICKDGTVLPVAYSASPLRADNGDLDGVVVCFRDATAESAQRRAAQNELDDLAWLGRVRDAIDEDRLVLYRQPIVPLTGGPPSEELLLRLKTPSGEIVPPMAFLPIAERYGMVADIDRWVVRQAVLRAAAGHHVEANISAWTIANIDLLPLIARLLNETGADPANLVFEITETAIMRNIDAGLAFAQGLRDLGCGLALDDFGTGFASFTYLKTLPFTHLKIDIDFVRGLAESPANRHVVDAIVSLAKGFGQKTIAEGVEDQGSLDILKERGVDMAQGYHLGRPEPIDER